MKYFIGTLLAGFFSLIAVGMLGAGAFWAKYEKPDPQPIAFPHNKHAGNLNLQCTHCHNYVEKSRFAGIPAVKICMDCHLNAPIESPEIDKLKQYWADQEPIPWQRIHYVPPHVYFNHKRHIAAGIECESCHGDMTVVDRVKQVRTLKMGFCVSCHNAKGAPVDCWTCHG